jgi:hypothetical protein
LAERIQFIEQAPGPRGSPHVPQGPDGGAIVDLAGPLECAANTDSCFCSSTPWHAGHDGDCLSRVRYSK